MVSSISVNPSAFVQQLTSTQLRRPKSDLKEDEEDFKYRSEELKGGYTLFSFDDESESDDSSPAPAASEAAAAGVSPADETAGVSPADEVAAADVSPAELAPAVTSASAPPRSPTSFSKRSPIPSRTQWPRVQPGGQVAGSGGVSSNSAADGAAVAAPPAAEEPAAEAPAQGWTGPPRLPSRFVKRSPIAHTGQPMRAVPSAGGNPPAVEAGKDVETKASTEASPADTPGAAGAEAESGAPTALRVPRLISNFSKRSPVPAATLPRKGAPQTPVAAAAGAPEATAGTKDAGKLLDDGEPLGSSPKASGLILPTAMLSSAFQPPLAGPTPVRTSAGSASPAVMSGPGPQNSDTRSGSYQKRSPIPSRTSSRASPAEKKKGAAASVAAGEEAPRATGGASLGAVAAPDAAPAAPAAAEKLSEVPSQPEETPQQPEAAVTAVATEGAPAVTEAGEEDGTAAAGAGKAGGATGGGAGKASVTKPEASKAGGRVASALEAAAATLATGGRASQKPVGFGKAVGRPARGAGGAARRAAKEAAVAPGGADKGATTHARVSAAMASGATQVATRGAGSSEHEMVAAAENASTDTDAPGDDAEDSAEGLGQHKLPELRNMAKERGLKGYSKMKKAELVDALSSP
eukprot:jgi/Mesen1/8918/ME000548S08425